VSEDLGAAEYGLERFRREVDVEKLFADRVACGRVLSICREIERRRRELWAYTFEPDDHPLRPQLAFLKSRDSVRLITGGNQSGKSLMTGAETCFHMRGSHPWQPVKRTGGEVYVVSAMAKTVEMGVFRHLMKWMFPWEWSSRATEVLDGTAVPRWMKSVNYETKARGSVNFFIGGNKTIGRRQVQAAAVNLVVIDEEIPEAIQKELSARLLTTDGRMVVSLTAAEGRRWVKALALLAQKGDSGVSIYRFSLRRAREAGHVSQAAFDRFVSGLSEKDIAIRVDGFLPGRSGMVYPELGPAHRVKDFEIPKEWPRYFGFDPGWRNAGMVWAAKSPSGHVVVYRAIKAHQETAKSLGLRIKSVERWPAVAPGEHYWDAAQSERVVCRWIDPAGMGHHESGALKIGHLLGEQGLYFSPAVNDVEYGIECVHQRLEPGLDGVPGLVIFDSCESLWDELSEYRRTASDDDDELRDEKKERPIKRHDHCADALRYLCASGFPDMPDSESEAHSWLKKKLEARDAQSDGWELPLAIAERDRLEEFEESRRVRRNWFHTMETSDEW
jgi:hypothetical protein